MIPFSIAHNTADRIMKTHLTAVKKHDKSIC